MVSKKKNKKEAALQQEDFNFDGGEAMSVNNLFCEFNMPSAVASKTITDADGNKVEVKAGLPPHRQRQSFAVDEYPACSPSWMNGSSKASSYFVPVKEGNGMWLDFNRCGGHTHDVAIVISVQGVNSITGQKTDQLRLEKYKTQCPVHEVDFAQDRFCPKCEYTWPAQNYLASTGTRNGELWLDGFRTPDGKVRQYIFSAEEARGVAANIIGKDRVFAIGVAFYLSKEPKPVQMMRGLSRGGGNVAYAAGLESMGASSYDDYESESLNFSDTSQTKFLKSASGQSRGMRRRAVAPKKKNYEVAAGAAINQEVSPDPMDIDHWAEEPAGMIYVNYCDEATALHIIQQGKRDEVKEGFLSGIPVGN